MAKNARFRGKCMFSGEWVYGDLIHLGGGTLIYKCDECKTELVGEREMPDGVVLEFFTGEVAIVIPDSVEQIR